MEIFNKIFEVCEIKIKGKIYKLKFTLSAVLWLEQKGIKIETLSVNLTKYPKTTIFMLAYAGLPTEEFRDKLSFEEFIRSLNDNEQLNIVKKLDLLINYFCLGLLAPYLERACFLSATPAVSRVPRIM